MRHLAILAAVAALSACGSNEEPANDAVAAPEAMEAENAATATPASLSTAQSLNQTSWEFEAEGKRQFESIDENGKYITQTPEGEHLDHGRYVLKDGKACFTSEMGDGEENCFTGPPVAVGETVTVTNDKGETLDVTRAEYRPLTM